jgi:hypothetical protein
MTGGLAKSCHHVATSSPLHLSQNHHPQKSIAYTLTHAVPELVPVFMALAFFIPLALPGLVLLTIDLITEQVRGVRSTMGGPCDAPPPTLRIHPLFDPTSSCCD